MSDKWSTVLENYDFTVSKTSRTRGAYLLETDCGYYLLKEFTSSKKHLEFEDILLNEINNRNIIGVDYLVKNRMDNLITEDSDGILYVLRRWYNAKDCDVRNITFLHTASSSLACLHNIMCDISGTLKNNSLYMEGEGIENEIINSLLNEYDRHNKELKRTRNYIRGKHRKNEFELLVLQKFEEFYELAKLSSERLIHNGYENLLIKSINKGQIIHGAYNYHNIMFGEDKCIIVNFEHSKPGLQIKDLYDFLRKVMEKHNWSYELGHRIIYEYDKIRPITTEELNYLKMRLIYPEKFWKIVNHYYNNNKAWVPDKDIEKLRNVISQNRDRMDFINSI